MLLLKVVFLHNPALFVLPLSAPGGRTCVVIVSPLTSFAWLVKAE